MTAIDRERIVAALGDAGRTESWLAHAIGTSVKYVTEALAGTIALNTDVAERMLAAIVAATAVITGPAVTFDPAALLRWLASEGDDSTGRTFAQQFGADQVHPDAPLSRVLTITSDVLTGFREEYENPDVWALTAGVNAVGMFGAVDGDRHGAIIFVDLGDGVRLASLHQGYDDMGGNLRGVGAIVAALSTIAEQANKEVTTYRRANRLDHEVTYHTVQIDLTGIGAATISDYLAVLANTLRVKRVALDRAAFFVGNQYAGWRLDRHFDLAAAIRFCESNNIPYVETRETVGPAAEGEQ